MRAIGALLLACGCAGAIGEGEPPQPTATAPASRASDGETARLAEPAPRPAAPAPPGQLRRLTRLQYENTLRDLLGASVPASITLPADVVVDGFDGNAAALTVSPQLAEAQLALAEQVAGKAAGKDAALAPCPAGRGWTAARGRSSPTSDGAPGAGRSSPPRSSA